MNNTKKIGIFFISLALGNFTFSASSNAIELDDAIAELA